MNSQRLIENFFKLVQIDSPTGEESAMVAFLASFLKEEGLVDVVTKDNFGNLYARLDGTGEPIFLTDHVDTVEPGRTIKPQIKEGFIQSDGTTILGADDKSSIAALLEALFIIKEQKLPHRPIEIIFTISEEVGNLGAVNFDYSLLRAKRGFCFDSSRPLGSLTIASPFYERFDLKLIGRSAHASIPHLGIHVLPVLSNIISNFPLGRLDPDTIFNIGVVEGGYVRNAVLGEILLKGEIRSFREIALVRHKKRFEKVLKQVTRQIGADFEITWVRENPGFKYSKTKQSHIVKRLSPIFAELNIKLNPIENWAVSDTNIFEEKGLECINLGGGREFAHTTAERIKVADLEKLAILVAKLIAL